MSWLFLGGMIVVVVIAYMASMALERWDDWRIDHKAD
jgi:hypothetical protein